MVMKTFIIIAILILSGCTYVDLQLANSPIDMQLECSALAGSLKAMEKKRRAGDANR